MSSPARSDKGKSGELQVKPDMSGMWLLDAAPTAKDASKRGATVVEQVTLEISHREPEIRIARRRSDSNGQERKQESVYYTDGRGETNQGGKITALPAKDASDELEEVKSKTRWKGNKLVSQAVVRKPLGGLFLTINIVEEWELARDGKTLTQTTTFRVINSADFMQPGLREMMPIVLSGPQKYKNVFGKAH